VRAERVDDEDRPLVRDLLDDVAREVIGFFLRVVVRAIAVSQIAFDPYAVLYAVL
jgi:hypothetical protein